MFHVQTKEHCNAWHIYILYFSPLTIPPKPLPSFFHQLFHLLSNSLIEAKELIIAQYIYFVGSLLSRVH